MNFKIVSSLRRNAGLLIAIAGVVVCLSSLLVTSGYWSLLPKYALMVSIIGLCLFAFLNPQRVRRLITKKLPRYALNTLILILSILMILTVINYGVYLKPIRWDITEGKEFSLSPDTIALLQKLESPIRVQAFFSAAYPSDTMANLLESFAYQAPEGMFTYQFIDPDAEPLVAQEANVLKDGALVLRMGERVEQVLAADEQKIISAIIRLIDPVQKSITFLSGHGEYDPLLLNEELSYSYVSQVLATKNYVVQSINLMTLAEVPDTVTTIVIAGPQKPLTAVEIEMIDAFVDRGGNLVVLFEPIIATDIQSDNDPLADYLGLKWGIAPQGDVILDPYVSPPVIAIAEYYLDHPITTLLQTTATVFPTSTSLTFSDEYEASDMQRTKLILTSNAAWGETSDEEILAGNPVYTEGIDFKGPLLLAVAGENPLTTGRMVVVGDSDFGSDAYFQEYANGDLIINMIEWANGETELLSLTPGSQISRVLVPPSNLSLGTVLLATVFLLPGTFVILGILTLIKQRRTM